MASSPQHEPTMEEILASIRKIISEDSNEAHPAKQADADVLELTQEVHEEPASSPAAAAAPEVAAAAPETEHEALHAPEPEPAPEHPAEPTAEAPAPENDIVFVSHEESTVSSSAQDNDHDGIFSDKSRKAIDDAFAGLDAMDEEPTAAPSKPAAASVHSAEGDSVEAVFERGVRASVEPLLHQWMDGHKNELLDAVKPLIREWMDEHFPALLEGAVRDEVARVVKARGRR
jgi:cell pole-organizing protein PopZ